MLFISHGARRIVLVDGKHCATHNLRRFQSRGKEMTIATRTMLTLLAIGWAGSSLAALTADYQFQHTLTSSVGGAPALTNVGPDTNVFAVENVDGVNRTVLTFLEDNGVELSPTTGVTGNSTYTIVILASLDLEESFGRYVDFKNAASDTGLYDFKGQLNFFDSAIGPGAPITADSWRQIVVTRNGVTGTIVGYVDGVQQFSFVDASGDGIISAANTLRFFIDDNESGGDAADGAVARIRIYDNALSPAEVAALDRLPPGAVVHVPTLSPFALLALAALLGIATWAARRRRRGSA
jgi:hypothetical protein